MMAVPSRNLGDLLVTNWAEPILLFPEIDEPLFPLVGIHHLHVQALFIVGFPRGIVWISFSTDFRVSFDGNPCGVCEILEVFFDGSVEHPVISSHGGEVFLRDPCIGFSRMSPFGPLSYHTMNSVVYCSEGVFAHNVLVIERPSTNDGVKFHDQFPC